MAVLAVFVNAGSWLSAPVHAQAVADGPWSGQMQCVLNVSGSDYQAELTHTWRITGGPPESVGMFRRWPAVWTVEGRGSRQLPKTALSQRARDIIGSTSESWQARVPETRAPISFWEPAAGRIRIASQHGLIVANGAITGTATAGTPINASLEEWPFPVVEDNATATTISGTRTRSAPYVAGWRQAPTVPTMETCTWSFTRGGATQSSSGLTGATSTSVTLGPAGAAGTIQTPTPTTAPTLPADTLSRETVRSTRASSTVNALAPIPPRTITLSGWTGESAFAPVPARTITLSGWTGAGGDGALPARTITLSGWTGAGTYDPVPARTLTLPGWTGVGDGK